MGWVFPWNRKIEHSVVLGGKSVTIKPVGIEGAVRLCMLVAPYLSVFDRYLPDLRAGLSQNDGVLMSLVRAMLAEGDHLPGDVIKMVAVLTDTDPEWLASSATAEELVGAVAVIDEVNRFGDLLLQMLRSKAYSEWLQA